MKASALVLWLALALTVLVAGLAYFSLKSDTRKSPVESNRLAEKEGDIDDFPIPISWTGLPEGLSIEADRSDWEVYARGERSIVIYDFRAEVLSAHDFLAAGVFEMSLFDEDDRLISQTQYQLPAIAEYRAGERLPINWYWQDTLKGGGMAARMELGFTSSTQKQVNKHSEGWGEITYTWEAEQNEKLDFTFEIREVGYQQPSGPESLETLMVLMTRNLSQLVLEYLQLRLEAYDPNDVVVYSREIEAIDPYDPPLRGAQAMLKTVSGNWEGTPLQIEAIAYWKVVILEVDY